MSHIHIYIYIYFESQWLVYSELQAVEIEQVHALKMQRDLPHNDVLVGLWEQKWPTCVTFKVQLKIEDNDSFFSLSFLTGKNETFEILTSVKITQKKLEQWGGPYLCLARGKNEKMKKKAPKHQRDWSKLGSYESNWTFHGTGTGICEIEYSNEHAASTFDSKIIFYGFFDLEKINIKSTN